MSRRGIRIVPKTKDPMTPLVNYSMKRGWSLEGALPRDAKKRESGEITYLVLENDTYVILRDDVLTGVHYLTVWGPAENDVAQEIRDLVESYSEQELLEWWDRAEASNDIDDKVDAILFIAVGSPAQPEQAFVQRIQAALRDPDKAVRNAATVAAGYADWPLLKPELESIAANDPDETCRTRARVVLDQWSKPES